eukprot:sb/3465272/
MGGRRRRIVTRDQGSSESDGMGGRRSRVVTREGSSESDGARRRRRLKTFVRKELNDHDLYTISSKSASSPGSTASRLNLNLRYSRSRSRSQETKRKVRKVYRFEDRPPWDGSTSPTRRRYSRTTHIKSRRSDAFRWSESLRSTSGVLSPTSPKPWDSTVTTPEPPSYIPRMRVSSEGRDSFLYSPIRNKRLCHSCSPTQMVSSHLYGSYETLIYREDHHSERDLNNKPPWNSSTQTPTYFSEYGEELDRPPFQPAIIPWNMVKHQYKSEPNLAWRKRVTRSSSSSSRKRSSVSPAAQNAALSPQKLNGGFFSLQSLRIPDKVYRYSRSDYQAPDRSSDIQDLTYSIPAADRAQISEGCSSTNRQSYDSSRQEIINQAELEIQTITRNYEASFSYTDEDMSDSSKN